MGTLKDELLKAGLVDEKRVRQFEHDRKVKRKRQGREQEQQETRAKKDEAQQQREAQRAADREREEARQAETQARERALQERSRRESAIEQAYREGQLRRWEGQRRYYYVDGRQVVYLNVNDEAGRKLEHGQAAIVQGPKAGNGPTVVNAAAAKRLREVAPERVLTFHTE